MKGDGIRQDIKQLELKYGPLHICEAYLLCLARIQGGEEGEKTMWKKLETERSTWKIPPFDEYSRQIRNRCNRNGKV